MSETTTPPMHPRYWLARAKKAMQYYGNGTLWLPGSTTWRHYMPDLKRPQAAIYDAQRRGYLTRGTGIPQLTHQGYRAG